MITIKGTRIECHGNTQEGLYPGPELAHPGKENMNWGGISGTDLKMGRCRACGTVTRWWKGQEGWEGRLSVSCRALVAMASKDFILRAMEAFGMAVKWSDLHIKKIILTGIVDNWLEKVRTRGKKDHLRGLQESQAQVMVTWTKKVSIWGLFDNKCLLSTYFVPGRREPNKLQTF